MLSIPAVSSVKLTAPRIRFKAVGQDPKADNREYHEGNIILQKATIEANKELIKDPNISDKAKAGAAKRIEGSQKRLQRSEEILKNLTGT